jgi:hypothetical protein
MAITSGVRHFVMAITSAEAMARHTALVMAITAARTSLQQD